MRRCRECGCLDEMACVRDGLLCGIETCYWAEEDLCAACNSPDASYPAWRHPPLSVTDAAAAR